MYKRQRRLGNHITDEDSKWAVFSELSSSPPTLETCRFLDAISCLPDYFTKNGDANGAYCQSYLEAGKYGIVTWVSLPEHRWPKHWKGKYTNPVVRLVLVLYGYPKSGRIWEDDCSTRVLDCGEYGGEWEIMSDSWPNVFWKPKIKAFMLVYVDDFKLVVWKGDQDELWKKTKTSHGHGRRRRRT